MIMLRFDSDWKSKVEVKEYRGLKLLPHVQESEQQNGQMATPSDRFAAHSPAHVDR